MSFPGARPSYQGFTSSHTLAVDNHAAQHNQEQADMGALSDKVGLGASTPTSGLLLRGNGAGASSWAQANLTSDVTGVLPQANGGTGITTFGTGVATFLGTPSSANLLAAMTTETGTGSLVFGTSPTLTAPVIADFTSANHDHSNAAGGGTINQAGLPTGVVVQIVYNETGVAASGTTLTPSDDTIPQNTEGDQYMSQSITPKSATNLLEIVVTANMASQTTGSRLISALFQDSGVNAIAVSETLLPTGTAIMLCEIRHVMVAGTTSSTTFNYRCGGSLSGTMTFNGYNGVRKYGGAMASSIVIREYKA